MSKIKQHNRQLPIEGNIDNENYVASFCELHKYAILYEAQPSVILYYIYRGVSRSICNALTSFMR